MARRKLTARERFDVLRRCNFACYYCGLPAAGGVVKLEIEHVIPVSRGGTNAQWNLVAACGPCNAGKSDLPIPQEIVQQIRREWVAYVSPRSDRPIIICRYCGIPVVLPEGEEAAIQCDSCLEWRIEAYEAGGAA